MIRKLTLKDKTALLAYASRHESENQFVIGSFTKYKKPFDEIDFAGAFQGKKLIGLGAFFKPFGSFVIHTKKPSAVAPLTDLLMGLKPKIETVPCFKKFAIPVLKHLKTKHKVQPKIINDSLVLQIQKKDFNDFYDPRIRAATKKDIPALIKMNDPGAKVNERTKKRIIPSQTWVIKEKGKIISTCNLQGSSKNIFQIGGMVTSPDHRGKGLAKKVISTLCREYFKKEKKTGQLFVKKENTPALAVYKKLGFKKTGQFIIAEF